MKTHEHAGRFHSSHLVLRPTCAAILLLFAGPVHAVTTIGSGTTNLVVSSDSSYVVEEGTIITVPSGDALTVNGIAPVTFVNGGTIATTAGNQAAGIRFNVPSLFTNLETGKLLGVTTSFMDLTAAQKGQIAAIAAGFTGLLSLFNIGGRFFWASLSDRLGRKMTYAIFFVLGFVLYASIPWTSHTGNIALFALAFCVIYFLANAAIPGAVLTGCLQPRTVAAAKP